ncbi:MAG TPA: 30S ribosomal protein S17 [bacterium]|nr:30S ribosomal protein S17 [bacterium]HPQ65965.1 30S ribosomal protein S17 [bacterium]
MERGHRKVRRGEVVSDAMEKTVVVKVTRTYRHPLYKKVVKRASLHKVHDENNEARRGDFVQIVETRPISKTKRWRLERVITSSVEQE